MGTFPGGSTACLANRTWLLSVPLPKAAFTNARKLLSPTFATFAEN